MDFVERLFGISPDKGSGLYELLLVVVPMLAIAGWTMLRQARRNREH